MKASLVAILALLPAGAGAETVHFKPTVGYPTFAVRPAVLTVKPGDVLESESLWGDWYEKPGGKWPGEVGRARADGLVPREGPLRRDPKSATGVVSPTGVFGDPTLATWAKGERVTEAMVGDILAEIDTLAAAPVPPGTPRSPLEDGIPR